MSLAHVEVSLTDIYTSLLFDLYSTSYGRRQWHPTQYSCLEKSMDGGAWKAAVHGVAEVGHDWVTSLSLFTFTFHFHALEKEMATYSRVLAWRIPGTGEPGGLPSMGSHRVGHDWSDSAAAATSYVDLHPALSLGARAVGNWHVA